MIYRVQFTPISLSQSTLDGRVQRDSFAFIHLGHSVDDKKFNVGAVRTIRRLVDYHSPVPNLCVQNGHEDLL